MVYANRELLMRVAGRALWATFVAGSLVFSVFTNAAGEHSDAPPTLPDPRTTYSPYLQDAFPNQVFLAIPTCTPLTLPMPDFSQPPHTR